MKLQGEKELLVADNQKFIELLGKTQRELSVANNALAAERAVSDALKNENSIIAEKLAKIKEIVGG